METVKGLSSFVAELNMRRASLVDELSNIDATLSHLAKLGGASNHTEPRISTGSNDTQPKRIVSAASRRKMALAQRARYAKARKESQPVVAVAKSTGAAPAKHTMSASARRKIAAAQKARWAKLRAGEKKTA